MDDVVEASSGAEANGSRGFLVSLMKDGRSAEEMRRYDIAAPDENE